MMPSKIARCAALDVSQSEVCGSVRAFRRSAMKRILLAILALFAALPAFAENDETPPFLFVSTYVQHLAVNERIRLQNEREFAVKGSDPLENAIRGSTRSIMQLRAQIGMLGSFHLSSEHSPIQNIIDFDERKIELLQRISDTASTMIAGPKPGVDYGQLAAEMPKISASIEFVDESLFKVTPLVFAMLIRPTPDKDNHMSRLVITTDEKARLVHDLDAAFGKKMDAEDQNYVVSSASVLKFYLTKKGYQCTDEPGG